MRSRSMGGGCVDCFGRFIRQWAIAPPEYKYQEGCKTPCRPLLAPRAASLAPDPQTNLRKMSPTQLTLTAEHLGRSTRTFVKEEFSQVSGSPTRSRASSEGSAPCSPTTTNGDGKRTGTSDSVSSTSSGSSGVSTCVRAKISTPSTPAIPKRRARNTRAKAAVKEQILAVRLPPPKLDHTHSHSRVQPSAASTATSSSHSRAAPNLDYTLIPEELETHILFGWKKRNVLDYFGYPDDAGVTEVESRLKHYGPGKFPSLSPFAESESDCFQDSTLLPELCASLARIPHVDESTK
jgi:hypothetical protein